MEAHHSQRFTVAFWRGLQERTGAGEILDFFPYDQERRFARA
jgi:isocitrate dehydrogenase kinase/phosphatase